MSTDALMVFNTCPDHETAERIARQLVEQRVAACVSLGASPVQSFYTWQGRVESEQEVALTIKTSVARYAELERLLVELHPYEVPEILAAPVERGLASYLKWVDECTES